MLPHWMHHHQEPPLKSDLLPVKPVSQNPEVLVSPLRPGKQRQQRRHCRPGRTLLDSPKYPTKAADRTTARFAFTDRLGGRFFSNNTLTSATLRADRKQRAAERARNRFHFISESLKDEIAQVEHLEKRLRLLKLKQRKERTRKKNAAASKIQRRWRLFCILHHRARRRKKKMAMTLRQMLHGGSGKRYAFAAADRLNAELLSAVLGGTLSGLDPEAYARYRKESFAKDIQRWWRDRLRHLREKQMQYMTAVVMIQRTWRGKVGRRRAVKLAEIRARKQLLGMGLSAIGRTMYKKRMMT